MNTVNNPTAFISYSWDDAKHKIWVRDFAARLRGQGVDVMLDQWENTPGDQIPEFMERAIRDNDYVLIICTPRYKKRSDNREGGVGYEGDIMTAEVLTTQNNRKFIPIWRRGTWEKAAPSWLHGKYYVNLCGDPYSEKQYADLLTTIYGARQEAPPLGPIPEEFRTPRQELAKTSSPTTASTNDIKIRGIIVDEVTEPTMDGTRGSALYRIPLQFSRTPSAEWARVFVETWDRPPRFTTMHRPGIASVQGDRIILDGTMIEEVEKYHRDTLVLVVEQVNKTMAERNAKRRNERERQLRQSEEHRQRVEEVSKRIQFEDGDLSDPDILETDPRKTGLATPSLISEVGAGEQMPSYRADIRLDVVDYGFGHSLGSRRSPFRGVQRSSRGFNDQGLPDWGTLWANIKFRNIGLERGRPYWELDAGKTILPALFDGDSANIQFYPPRSIAGRTPTGAFPFFLDILFTERDPYRFAKALKHLVEFGERYQVVLRYWTTRVDGESVPKELVLEGDFQDLHRSIVERWDNSGFKNLADLARLADSTGA